MAANDKLKRNQTIEMLMKYVIDAGLKVGDTLPKEDELAQQFGVSRVSIREATNGLKFLGMLESAPRRGTTLSSPDYDQLCIFLGFQMAFSYSEKAEAELLQVRSILELGHLDVAQRAMTYEDYESLKKLARDIERKDDSPESIARHLQADNDFHRELLKLGGNGMLTAFSRLIESFFQQPRKEVGTIEESVRAANEHLELVEALYDGNLDLARGILRRHLSHINLFATFYPQKHPYRRTEDNQ